MTETNPSPTYALTGLSCSEAPSGAEAQSDNSTVSLATRTSTIIAEEGEIITCTYTNTLQTGTIQIEKQTTPAGGTGFSFTGTDLPGTSNDTFSLDDDGVKTVSNVPVGTYHVIEDGETGWDLTSISCDDSDSTGTGSTATFIVAAGETVKCTFNNRQEGKVIVEKQTDPANSAEAFTFDPGAGLTPTANFDLVDNGTKSFDVDPGTYTVDELAETGWDLTSISCDDSNSTGTGSTATFIVAAGETVKCTFNNRQEGKVIVEKQTDPANSAEAFTFDPGAGLTPTANFDLVDNGTKSFDVDPGTYTVDELAETGWDLTSISCDDSNSTGTGSTATFIVAAGETVKCTFNNRQEGKVIVEKQTTPANSAEAFTFDPGAGLTPTANFDLVDNGTKSFDVDPGTYTVDELAETGWDLTSISCDDSNSTGTGSTATFIVAAGETVKCTFNNRQEGKVIVEKQTDPANSAEAFTFDPGAGLTPTANFDLVDNGTKSFDVDPGTYTVDELAETGWDLTSISCDDSNSTGTGSTATFIVAAGETVKCTFNNRQEGKVIVEKQTTPANSAEAFTFDPGAGLTPTANFDLVDNGTKSFDVDPGTYTVDELAETGWDLTSISCDDSNSTGTGSTATFIVAAGETVKCTFNNRQEGKVIVEKQTDPANSAEAFTFDPGAGLTPTANFDLVDNGTKSFDVDPGTYTVDELAETGWDLTSISCDDSNSTGTGSTATFIVAAGETVKCTFNNRQEGKVIVEKQTTPANSAEAFTFDPGAGLTPTANFDLVDNGTKSFDVDPGTYTVDELAETGWDLTSISCDDSNSTGTGSTATFIVAAGETVKCTFNNRQEGKVIVEKQTDPANSAEAFTFDPGAGLTPTANFDLVDNGTKSFDVDPGTYTVDELAETGWDLTSISCDDSNSTGTGSTATFIVAAGETVKCTFNNRQRGTVKVNKTVELLPPTEADGNIRFEICDGASTATGDLGTILSYEFANFANGGIISAFTVDNASSNHNGALNQGETLLLLPANTTFQLCEVVPMGYDTNMKRDWDNDGTVEYGDDWFYPGIDPNDVGSSSLSNEVVCINFSLQPGETKTFDINNGRPAMQRTIGFWKNWASCAGSKGGQKPILDQTLAKAPNGTIWSDLPVDSCAKAVKS